MESAVAAGIGSGLATDASTQTLVMSEVTPAASEVCLLRFRARDGVALPPWSPGDHLELILPSYRIRHYSLCGDPADRASYTVAVLRLADGRGGSIEIHDELRPGTELVVRGPRNNFPLVAAPAYLLLAGGIGITPLYAMATHLAAKGAQWRIVYGARSRAAAAFLHELGSFGDEHLTFVPEDEAGRPDFRAAIETAPSGTAIYCCGPSAMIAAIEQLCRELNRQADLRIERFGGSGSVAELDGVDTEFELELARTGTVLTVPADRSALDVVHEVLPEHPYSCLGGQCGSCKVSVLAGEVDHRDEVLADEERSSNSAMTLCVSRARSARLVIEL